MTRVFCNLYRLQLHAQFTFEDARAVLPYLKSLGIDTLYCSPFFQAIKGSTHGYDVANPLIINEELGGEEGFDAFQCKARSLGMSIILDLVANHMAASVQNPWWYDILEQGPHSLYAAYFDINWDSPQKNLTGKVLVPILDLPSKEALLEGKITLALTKQGLFIHAMGEYLPLNPRSYLRVSEEIKTKQDLHNLLKDETLSKELKEKVRKINRDQKQLQTLLDEQYFFLEFWQYAPQNINYRRFFDINGLAALNMNHPRCFEHCHERVFQLFQEEKIQGIRVDHPDGIYEPYFYFSAIKAGCKGKQKPYLILEKILEREEKIPQEWPVQGSVGYEYLNLLNQVFVKSSEEQKWTDLYETFLEKPVDPEEMSHKEKREYALLYMMSEIRVMALKLYDKEQSSYTLEQLIEALIELHASFPVYRTYLKYESVLLSEEDKEVFFEAFDRARLSKPSLEPIFQMLKEVFFHERELSEQEKAFIMRFQQIAPVIMAKGFEDTHLYNYNRFIALNEVGSSPHHFGESIEFFHEKIREKHKQFPYGWVTVSTHDTKRSQDIRMRLSVLSEIPEEWGKQVVQWKREHAGHKRDHFPDFNREYFLYQTLVGSWPREKPSLEEKSQFIERVKNYLIKASRESKAYTNWTHHHTAYEQALQYFIEAILKEESSFYRSLGAWVKKIDRAGQLSSLSCLNLLLTLPASLDVYQGTELWDFSFVDPDNRRAVDYQARRALLKEIEQVTSSSKRYDWVSAMVKQENLERLKLYMLTVGLHLRLEGQKDWMEGEYTPVIGKGRKQDHLIAYIRKIQGKRVLVLSGRFLLQYRGPEFWKETYLELPEDWKQALFLEVYTQRITELQKRTSVQDLLTLMPFGVFIEQSAPLKDKKENLRSGKTQ